MNPEQMAELKQRIAKINATALVLNNRLKAATNQRPKPLEKVEGAYILGDGKPPAQGKSFVQGDGNAYGVQKDGPDAGDVHVPAPIGAALNDTARRHNAKVKKEWQQVTPMLLQKVYARGVGAYGDGTQATMTKGAYSMARVDAYLKLLRAGRPEDKNYTQDFDLLPPEHPKHKG